MHSKSTCHVVRREIGYSKQDVNTSSTYFILISYFRFKTVMIMATTRDFVCTSRNIALNKNTEKSYKIAS